MQLHFFWPAVAVATVLGLLIPALWFAPKAFGRSWQALCQLSDEQLRDPLPRLGYALLCSFVSALALAGLMNFIGSATFLQGALLGLQVSLAFQATALSVDHVFARRPLKLQLIVVVPNVLALALMGGLLAAWKG